MWLAMAVDSTSELPGTEITLVQRLPGGEIEIESDFLRICILIVVLYSASSSCDYYSTGSSIAKLTMFNHNRDKFIYRYIFIDINKR